MTIHRVSIAQPYSVDAMMVFPTFPFSFLFSGENFFFPTFLKLFICFFCNHNRICNSGLIVKEVFSNPLVYPKRMWTPTNGLIIHFAPFSTCFETKWDRMIISLLFTSEEHWRNYLRSRENFILLLNRGTHIRVCMSAVARPNGWVSNALANCMLVNH